MAGAVFLTRRTNPTVVVSPKKPKAPDLRPQPGSAFWGKITGNIEQQADLIAKFSAVNDAIQEAKDWAVVGWVL